MKTLFACRFRQTVLFLLPFLFAASAAEAQVPRPNAYVTANVNHRAGPGTQYPVLGTVPVRSYVTIHGCLQAIDWCDVTYQNARGWMAATYLSAYSGRYMPVAEYVRVVRLPVVVFDIQTYWPRYYRDRPFFAEMARWSQPQPRRPRVTEAVFYRPLAEHGSWVEIRGQRCWVPAGVDRDWRPYTRGRWVYTKYGWTWVSNEPFGWATYHYGRWGFSKRVGWFWVPGTRWAPAWVAWRGSDDYLAWAPLPPDRDPSISIEISFGDVPDYYWQAVPSSAFLSVNLHDHVIHDERDFRPIFRDTRPIGNVTIVNNVVVNNVVNIEYVEQKTQETVVVQEIAATTNTGETEQVEDGKVEILTAEAAATAEPPAEAPPEVKPIEQVEAEATTKEQAGDQPATEELVTAPPPEETTAEGQPPEGGAPPEDGTATSEPALPPGDQAPAGEAPVPESMTPEGATPPVLPPPTEGAPPAEGAPQELPPPPPETAPQELPPPPELAPPPEGTPQELPPPPPPETTPQELPPPPEAAPPPEPPPAELPPPPETTPQELPPPPEAAPPPEPPPAEPPPPPETAPQELPPPPEAAPPPEPPPVEPPPPPETAPQELPPPPEAAPPPEPPPPAEPPPPPETAPQELPPPPEAAPPAEPPPVECPEGTVPQQDGSCAPAQ